MKRILFIIALAIVSMAADAMADDLFNVTINSVEEADLLQSSGCTPVYRVSGGYLVLAGKAEVDRLLKSGLKASLAASDVDLARLAIDMRLGDQLPLNHRLAYQEGNLRIFEVEKSYLQDKMAQDGIVLLSQYQPPILYRAPMTFNPDFSLAEINLDSLIGLVSLDSAQAYTERLQGFFRRVTGTDSCYAARDWLAAKFASFGYDSVIIDSFIGRQLYSQSPVPAQNVVAVKIGSKYPNRQIVIGGHYDAVPPSPGADDNASGTAATLEMARVLRNLETEVTLVFIAFDSEESGLLGSDHYADNARARGDSIIYMLNLDMIGHLDNSTLAKLFYGPEIAYSQLWGKLADSLVGITGVLSGSSGGSDHLPFIQNGYDATFVHEYTFSSVYHTFRDSTTFMNFDYMTRMIKASLATGYTVSLAPPPVLITSVQDVGNGQAMKVNWFPADPTRITHFWLYYYPMPSGQPDSVQLPVDSSSYTISGLTTNQEYSFYLIAFDNTGRSSLSFSEKTGTPRVMPAVPAVVSAKPQYRAIKLAWAGNNIEIDFDHYEIIRDNAVLVPSLIDTFYIDADLSLGSALHSYRIRAVDADGNRSDTTGIAPVVSKAAQLTPETIMAVNRSTDVPQVAVDEIATGLFLRNALSGLNYTYYSDSNYFFSVDKVDILDMVDYSLVIIGAEAGRGSDDIGLPQSSGGLMEDLRDYLAIGGKAIIFGRWGGNFATGGNFVDTVFYYPGTSASLHNEIFHAVYRIQPLSVIQQPELYLLSDMIGAHSLNSNYPALVWDSVATLNHTGAPFVGITGIPFVSFPLLAGGPVDTLYTYDSDGDSAFTEGRPMAWRYSGSYDYIFFNMPLSFMQWPASRNALRQAVADLGLNVAVGDQPDDGQRPSRFELAQNYPNPFNPNTQIEFYNPLPRLVMTTLEVFNILGQKVRVLFDGLAAPGRNRAEWDGRDALGKPVASGIYLYRLKSDDATLTRKMLLMK